MTSKSPKSAAPAAKVSADEGSTGATLVALWPYIWPADRPDLKMRVVWAVLALVVAKIVTVFSPYFFAWASDALTGETAGLPAFLVAPVMLVLAYNAARVLAVAFNQLRDALFAQVGQHAVRELGNITFAHLHRLSLRFHLTRRTGGLSRVIERGVKGIEAIVRFTILNGIPTLLEFAIMAGLIWWQFGFFYVVIVAVMIVAYVWFTVKTSNWRIAIRREMNDSDTDANSKAIDSLLNYETVKYFGNEKMEAARFDVSMASYEKAAVRTWTSLAWLNFGQSAILGLGTAACMALSAMAVLNGTQTIGDFVLINALLMQIAIPLNFVGFIYREIRQGLADIESMFSVLAVPAEIEDKPGAPALAVSSGAIRFEDVTFHYDPDRQILKGLTFDVPAGHTVAVVGPSGAGKSTLSRLLFRFYDVTGGRITIDGQDIRDITQESLRSAIGMVPQDTVLFNDTIAYNIRYGRPGASLEEVQEAARMAQIAPFIETLPKGFDSEVGERGLKLSGGEKQRVAIARTILKAPPILILDEATSALDTHTEREIQTALDQVSQNRTTLVIAHRLSTVVNADQILVLEAGRIVERGTHAELLAMGGLYHSMWNRQREADEAEERLRAAREADKLGVVVRGRPAGE
ncbi:ATP-binding cassette domain-containing protein [Microvirga tunisiensis]|uniref:ATP-binding cassette domain-containing protein n=2 Tax=Pannonibacter tanglangensis TaxID=2750084 RepID=A0A7X5J842_9HYPH|nr:MULTISPECIES: ABC transporter ATP-binding protein/permease [unclassified Pannonibacter]NBN62644.1 ATP-binding cassette domain-containing protein [Pannonibacter sp. XCT-34]NBN78299.1 ATP-binding cassette domain-containing protein [Pannonibacter sp. XCT-53]